MVSDGARMTYDKSGDAKDQAHPTNDGIPRKPKKPIGKKTVTLVVVVVLAVIIAGIVGAVYVTSFQQLHLGIVSASEVSTLAGQPLNEGVVVPMAPNEMESEFYDSSGSIMVGSYEVSNTSQSSSAVSASYQTVVSIINQYNLTASFQNSSYLGFSFFIVQYHMMGSYYFVASGFSGHFGFLIEDSGISTISPSAIAHDEIEAML